METLPGHRERLPSGTEDLYAELIVSDRERIVAAMAELVAKRGYRHTTLELIQQRADVSRATFRRYFRDREACFLGCFEAGASEAHSRIEAAVLGEAEWPQQLRGVVAAALDYVAERPTYARVCLLESATIGPAGSEALRAALAPLVDWLRQGRALAEDPASLPESLEESIVGALVGMLKRRLERAESDSVRELLPTMVQFAALPYLGAAEADALAAASRA